MNMVEKVARAICYAGGNCAGKCQETTGHCRALPENLIGEYGTKGRQARAAIAAMRDPSEAQRAAGEKANTLTGNNNLGLRYTPYLPSWHAMIDAALAEWGGK